MSNRNPDRLAPKAMPPMSCIYGINYRPQTAPGGPGGGPHCFFFDCGGCMMYPRLKKSWELTDMVRGRCLLPGPDPAGTGPGRTSMVKD
jgi:hypothetical protein